MIEIPIPTEADCMSEAPDPYKSIMQFSHFLTIPLYTVAFYLLIFKLDSKNVLAYRKILIWHTAGNFIFEIYITVFMLPITYLPALVFRGTGILKYLNISGVVQFYLLCAFILHTVISIIHLFRFRFEVAITEMTSTKKFLLRIIYLFYFLSIINTIFIVVTTPRCIAKQIERKEEFYRENTEMSIEILCHTSIMALSIGDWVLGPMLLLIAFKTCISVFVVVFSFYQIIKQLERLSKHLSKKTIQLQLALLFSIVIQAGIHGLMLTIPVIGYFYVLIFSLDDRKLAHFLLLLIAFHGSVSTIAMIIFMKPLRSGIIELAQKLLPTTRFKQNVRTVNLSVAIPEPSIGISMKRVKFV